MGSKQVMKNNKSIRNMRVGKCQTTHIKTTPKVSKVSNSTWSKMAEKVLDENMGAWKTLAKE